MTRAIPPQARRLSADDLRLHFAQLDEHLPVGERFEITVAGGAPLVLLGLRGDDGSTTDIDSVTELPAALRNAALRVAEDNGLLVTWLNSSAMAFVPSPRRPGVVVYESDRLRVWSAAADDIFIMKIWAAASGGRAARDLPDLVALWSRCSYQSAQEAVTDYLERMPMVEDNDPFLVDWVETIVATAPGRDR